MNALDPIAKIVDIALTTIGIIGLVASIKFAYWVKKELKKVDKIEQRMLHLRGELDGGLAKQLKGQAVTMAVYEGRLKNLKEPAQAEYNQLELQRKFILEKIPLVGLFRK